MSQKGINPDGSKRTRTDQLARQVYAGGTSTRQTYPTPDCQNFRPGSSRRTPAPGRKEGTKHGESLHHRIYRQTYPTPGAMQRGAHKGTEAGAVNLEKQNRTSEAGVKYGATLQTVVGSGQLNPEWVEWLMGWPIGWTDLKPLETDRFRRWLRLHCKF